VVHLKKGSDNLHFFYDAQGRPAIVEFNGVKYGYVYNLQGDVVAIIDGSGNQVVEYTYDSWGRPLTKTGTKADTLGYLNPFRYRGYFFDEETELYYLRSRYYNPVWGRFIYADTVIGKKGSVLSHNVFAYCKNNPPTFSDVNGYMRDESGGLGGLPDFTEIINDRLAEAAAEFKKRSVGDGGPSTAGQMLSNFENYWWFYNQVDHNAPWDIKRKKPWRQQFPNLPFLSKFIFRGRKTNVEDLGNFTYGYLGSAMGIDREFLYIMGAAAKYTERKSLNPGTILDAVEKALDKGSPYYGDEPKDHDWIAYGIDAYNAQ
jgi:RHS repeat-associated protein